MRVAAAVAALGLVVMSVAPAQAFNWSMGVNSGFNMEKPDDVDLNGDGIKDEITSTKEFSFPAGVTPPGLRIGFAGEKPMHEFYIDFGIFLTSQKDLGSSRAFSASGNYQYNFGSGGSTNPYVTAGAGVRVGGFKDETVSPTLDASATDALFGGGLGIRHKMGNGHGVMRAEVRFDKATEGKDGNTIFFFASNIISLKVGFDIWDK